MNWKSIIKRGFIPLISYASVLYVFFNASLSCPATEWSAPKEETYSSGTKYSFDVLPITNEPCTYGLCQGVLWEQTDGKKKKLWSRYLANNRRPVDVVVSPNGKYVVTLDEWGRMGCLPVVFYGPGGELLQVFSINDLGIPHTKIKTAVGGDQFWRDNAIMFFEPESRYFIIWFPWEKVLVFDLGYRVHLCRKDFFRGKTWAQLKPFIINKIKSVAISLLDSSDPRNRTTGAIALGQVGDETAIPKLERLRDDLSFSLILSPDGMKKDFYVREAALKSLDLIRLRISNNRDVLKAKKKQKNTKCQKEAPSSDGTMEEEKVNR